MPKVSVILPVYNAGNFLAQAIDSLLVQTFSDIEVIIINDASSDVSWSIIQSYQDPRIIKICHKNNLGLIASLNEGLAHSKGDFVARMDNDDISMPERLERQVEFMECHPDYGLVGTTYAYIDENNQITGVFPALLNDSDLRLELRTKSSFGHGTVMMRRSLLAENGLVYDPAAFHAEDYDLWTKISRLSKIANLPDVLYLWRRHGGSITGRLSGIQVKNSKVIREKVFDPLLIKKYIHTDWKRRKYSNESKLIVNQNCTIRRKDAYCSMHLVLASLLFKKGQWGLGLKYLWHGLLINYSYFIKAGLRFFAHHEK